ncbi:MAG: N4-gp56 family major capsid protein [Ruminococcus sp.]|nr:N4-gp56 family major capsid protein [Ruminococcus sp.]
MTNINYAEKYEVQIDERFKLGSVTESAVNRNYNFDGVNKITVYSVETAPLNDYNRESESNRYGIAKELGNAVQSLTLTQDKSFTFTIDKGNYENSVLANSAGNALQRQLDEVVTPAIDQYRINVMAENAGTVIKQTITDDNAYQSFITASVVLIENKVPAENRIAFVSPAFYMLMKSDRHFTGYGDKLNDVAVTGSIAKIDGIDIVVVPSDYLPEKTNFIITHPMATVSPVKLAEYKTHDNPPGISGWLCEGRIYYDAFVLENKKKAIVISKSTEK